MAGLVPAIHVLLFASPKTWMPGTSPGMTKSGVRAPQDEDFRQVFDSAFFGVNVALRLSNNSTFTPLRRMM